MLYLVFQGAKQLIFGDEVIDYRSDDVVMMGMAIPALSRVTEADDAAPYLAVELSLDLGTIAELAMKLDMSPRQTAQAFAVCPLPKSVLEPTFRLLRLLDSPTDAEILADGLKREIVYRMLASPHGGFLLQLVRMDGVLARIRLATEWMRDNLNAPIHVASLANQAGTSVTSFHRHFKSATGTTPVEYHKRLRLHEGRRLLASTTDTVARISSTVGYASPSQFSRDFKSAFGTPPTTDPLRAMSRGSQCGRQPQRPKLTD
jgi:AraC-like DNA-binding protein